MFGVLYIPCGYQGEYMSSSYQVFNQLSKGAWGRPPEELARTVSALSSFLSAGPRLVKEIRQLTSDLNVSWPTMVNAKHRIGAISWRADNGWVWSEARQGEETSINWRGGRPPEALNKAKAALDLFLSERHRKTKEIRGLAAQMKVSWGTMQTALKQVGTKVWSDKEGWVWEQSF